METPRARERLSNLAKGHTASSAEELGFRLGSVCSRGKGSLTSGPYCLQIWPYLTAKMTATYLLTILTVGRVLEVVMVQWLRLPVSNTGDLGSSLFRGLQIPPHLRKTRCGQIKNYYFFFKEYSQTDIGSNPKLTWKMRTGIQPTLLPGQVSENLFARCKYTVGTQ